MCVCVCVCVSLTLNRNVNSNYTIIKLANFRKHYISMLFECDRVYILFY